MVTQPEAIEAQAGSGDEPVVREDVVSEAIADTDAVAAPVLAPDIATETEASIPLPAPIQSVTDPSTAPLTQPSPLEQRNRRLEQELAQYRQVQSQAVETERLQQYEQQLEALYLTPEQVQFFKQREQQQNGVIQEAQAKMVTAMQIGQQYNIPANDLMQYLDPQSMIAAAQTKVEMRTLKEEMAKLKQSQVPAQNFSGATPQGSGALDGARLEQAVGEGRVELTAEVRAKLNNYYKREALGG